MLQTTQLAEPVHITPYVQPVCLYDGQQPLRQPNDVIATGHGAYDRQSLNLALLQIRSPMKKKESHIKEGVPYQRRSPISKKESHLKKGVP